MDKEKEQLITENIKLAYYVAKRFLNSGIEYEDLDEFDAEYFEVCGDIFLWKHFR